MQICNFWAPAQVVWAKYSKFDLLGPWTTCWRFYDFAWPLWSQSRGSRNLPDGASWVVVYIPWVLRVKWDCINMARSQRRIMSRGKCEKWTSFLPAAAFRLFNRERGSRERWKIVLCIQIVRWQVKQTKLGELEVNFLVPKPCWFEETFPIETKNFQFPKSLPNWKSELIGRPRQAVKNGQQNGKFSNLQKLCRLKQKLLI